MKNSSKVEISITDSISKYKSSVDLDLYGLTNGSASDLARQDKFSAVHAQKPYVTRSIRFYIPELQNWNKISFACSISGRG